VLLGPFDARAGHDRRETLLVDADGVSDKGEVDEGDLEDVEGEIAFEDALSSGFQLICFFFWGCDQLGGEFHTVLVCG
jgi:hypothetical protein